MLKKIRKQLKNEKGLTLVELLAVIVILGIIAAIAIPAIGNIITNSKYNAVKADAINVLNAAQMYYLDNPKDDVSDTVTVGELITGKYLEDQGSIPDKASINNKTPHELTADAIPFAKGKTVKFTNATIAGINEDNQKGSDENITDIGGAKQDGSE